MSKKLVVFAPGLVLSSFGLVVSMQTYVPPSYLGISPYSRLAARLGRYNGFLCGAARLRQSGPQRQDRWVRMAETSSLRQTSLLSFLGKRSHDEDGAETSGESAGNHDCFPKPPK